MSKSHSSRLFSIFSCVEDEFSCYIVYPDASKASLLMDEIDASLHLAAISYTKKRYFLVDVQAFTDCVVVKVRIKGKTNVLDLLTVEAVATAEMSLIHLRLMEHGSR